MILSKCCSALELRLEGLLLGLRHLAHNALEQLGFFVLEHHEGHLEIISFAEADQLLGDPRLASHWLHRLEHAREKLEVNFRLLEVALDGGAWDRLQVLLQSSSVFLKRFKVLLEARRGLRNLLQGLLLVDFSSFRLRSLKYILVDLFRLCFFLLQLFDCRSVVVAVRAASLFDFNFARSSWVLSNFLHLRRGRCFFLRLSWLLHLLGFNRLLEAN
jgi:hypothetical protein